MGGCWVSNNMPRAPTVLNNFTIADANFSYVFKLHGTESTGHDANKTLDLSVILMTTRHPLNPGDETQSAGDETRTS